VEKVKRFLSEEDGQDLVEYVFLVAFIALFCVLAIQSLGVGVNNTYRSVEASFEAAGS
jgi:Flp pilus assembly pilin Flp